MQIRIVPENNIHITTGRITQSQNRSAQVSGSVFGAQCKLTISKEGRKLYEQSKTQTARSAQSIKAEKIMMRQQEESAQTGSIRDEYMARLKAIDEDMVSLKHAYGSGGDDEAALKKGQVLKAMREQLQTQLEENQKKQKAAQEMAMQSFEGQNEIDRKNRDLLIMLKSIEESEDAEEAEEGKSGETKRGSSGVGAKNSMSDIIQNSATQFGVSSVKRELNVVGMIEELSEDGHNYLDAADEITRSILKEGQSLRELLDDESYTDEGKAESMGRYQKKAMAGYKEAEKYRRCGLQMIRDAKDCKIQHIADNPLKGVDETKESMMLSAVDAAFNEASKDKLDEASQELADKVEELIDERNNVSHVDCDKKEEDKEDDQKIGELFQTEESEQIEE